jgi:hypothetical protein
MGSQYIILTFIRWQDAPRVLVTSPCPSDSKNGLKDTQQCFPSLRTKKSQPEAAADLELFEWSVFIGTLGCILLISYMVAQTPRGLLEKNGHAAKFPSEFRTGIYSSTS